MRLVIDMQGAQSSSSRHRGIGRYTLALAQAIARNRGSNEVFLCLSGLFPDSIAPIEEAFAGLLPPEHIRIWQAPGPLSRLDPANDWRRQSAELMREAFLASLEPDMVLVSSLFEGLDENAVTSIGSLAGTLPTAAILYDLIPLVHRERYLDNPVVAAWYDEKLEHLRRADLLFSISESSRQEAISHLGLSPDMVVNASTAAHPQFRPIELSAEQRKALEQRYGLHRPFVMYTGGIDHRKNIEGLIRAYALLPLALRAAHQLAIVCSVQPAARATLEALGREQGLRADELLLTGFVPEDDLLGLYNLCKAFVFPSWHEGFGLPALEAMSCGRAVIGANTSSVPEVIGREDALFDPMSDAAIAAKIEQVLSDEAFCRDLARHGLEQAKRFSWDDGAQRVVAAMEAWQVRHAGESATAASLPRRRPSLAYVSPLPPARSGISDYSAELLPVLAEHYDIEVVVAQPSVADAWITEHCPVRSVEWFREHAAGFDRILYQFGNSSFHGHMFELLRRHPGVLTLHDFFLSGVLAHEEQSGALPGAWTRALYQSHGYDALRRRCRAADPTGVIWRYPCNLEVLQNALGIVVHGENSRRLARRWYGEDAADGWAVIPLLRVAQQQSDRAGARRALGLEPGQFAVCSFGLLSPTKSNHRLLDAWLASALARDENCVLIFVGENHEGAYGRQLLQTIRKSSLESRIRITGWTDMSTFRAYLAAADVGVQLRTLSRGETPATVLDCMNYGLATIINAHGCMADLPTDAAWLLEDEFSDAELREALEALWRDGERRQRLATRARELIRTRHDPAGCAGQYHQAIEAMYRRAATGRHALVNAIAALAGQPSDTALALAAQAIAETCPLSPLQRQLLIEVPAAVANLTTGVAAQPLPRDLLALLQDPPAGFRVEPVYLAQPGAGCKYRYARAYTCRGLGIARAGLADMPIDSGPGDELRELTPDRVNSNETGSRVESRLEDAHID